MSTIWRINGQTPAELGISGLVLTYASLAPDTLTFRHEGAAWDSAPLFAYGTTLTLTRTEGAGSPVTVFIGRVRGTPRFLGAAAENVTYEVAGPWDLLERRALLTNQAIVLNPGVSLVPSLLPQGLAILGQSDAGTSVQLSAALGAVFTQCNAAGVATALGAGFDHGIPWDEVADLTLADAIIRLLSSAPDAVSWIDYTTTPNPTLHIARRANLAVSTVAVAPAGLGYTAPYTPLESVSVNERPDLVPAGVTIIYRRVDLTNGTPYLNLIYDRASDNLGYADSDENALVRTIELQGSNYTSTILEQPVRVTPLSINLTASGTIIPTGPTTDAFNALARFWKRKVEWLNEPGVEIKGFRNTGRFLTDTDSGDTLDLTLSQELIEGAITEWMESTALNRKGQEQTFRVEVAADVTTDAGTTRRIEFLSAGVMACNCASRTYRYTESSDYTPPEPTPTGLAAAIYAGMRVMPVEGTCELIEQECSLTIRPGKVVNLTGGRTSWQTMRGLVQRTIAQLDEGRTDISYGPPRQLGPADLVDTLRANRFKGLTNRGLTRTTGTP